MAGRKWPISPIGQQAADQLPMAEKVELLVSQEFGSDGLKASEREAICGVLAQFAAIQKAVLFGSRAAGTYSPTSDIDLVLYGDSLTQRDEFRIASRMEDLDLSLRVDLVRYATITSKDLLGHIRRDGKLFYDTKNGRGKADLGSLDMAGKPVTEEKPLHLPSRLAHLPAHWTWLRLDDACVGVFDCPHSTPRLG